MAVALLCLTAILVLDTLYRRWRKRRAPAHASTDRNISSGPRELAPAAKFWRLLVGVRVALEVAWWALVIGYVVLLIWTMAVGPIKPIHEWFTH